MKYLRSEEFRGVEEMPVPPKGKVYATQMEFLCSL